ncbi:MAG: hypothetical protein GY771_11160 [bacterium]|nr:hypothetical protein [bacterium]
MWNPKRKRKLKLKGRELKRADFAFPMDFAPEDKERFLEALDFPAEIDDNTLMKSLTLIQQLTLNANDGDYFVKLLRKNRDLVVSDDFAAVVNTFTAAYSQLKHPAGEMYPKFLMAIENELG